MSQDIENISEVRRATPVSAINTRALKPGFGVELLDIDVGAASTDMLDDIFQKFDQAGVLLIRNQNLEPADLVRFLGHYGELEGHTLSQFTLADYPEIFLLSNIVKDGKPIGAHNDGVGWHTDYSYKEFPVKSTMLYAVQVPDEGSDTLIADCVAAYADLSDSMRQRLENLQLHHSYRHFMETREHGRMILDEKLKKENPDVIHPLIRTHPENGRKALWPSTGTVSEISGGDGSETLELLDELIDFVTQERFVFRHKWQVGDILMWDNRCTLHTGTLFDDKKYERLMHRMWVKGERPV